MQQIMLVAPGNSSLLYHDTANFSGKSVTTIDRLGLNSYVTQYASENGISLPFNSVTDYESYYDLSNELLLTSSIMHIQDRKTVANLGLEQMYFVANPGNNAMLTELNAAITAVEVNSPLLMQNAFEKYYQESNVAKPVLTPEQMALLQAHPSFSVGYVSNHFPVESVGKNGGEEGIAVDIMKLVAAEAGIGLQFSPYSFEGGANHGSYDICIAWSALENFDDYYYATDSFDVSTPLILIAEEGVFDPSSTVRSIGILPFTTLDLNEVKASYPGASFTEYYNYEDLAKALKKGDVEAVLLSEMTADYILSILDDTDFAMFATNHRFPIRIFVNKNLGTEYLDIFNTLIARVNSVEINKVMLSSISGYRADPSLLEVLASYWYIYALGIAFVTGSFFAFYLILQRKKQQAVLDALNYDEITGLASEIKFITDVETIMKTAEDNEYMIITFDVDHFSLIRKQYGYDRSNDVLKKIGSTLVDNYPEGSLVARIKADLFVVFTKVPAHGRNVSNDNIIDCAQGLLASTHPLSVSQGLYRINDTTMPVQLMIDYCNMARLQGKSVYGLTLNEYTKELDEKRELNNSIVLRMERALLGKELIPYYQPKVHIKSSMITGVEALVRWCDIDSDLETPKVKYMPDQFIPLFEENGFIAKLDYHIFDEICGFIRRNMKNHDIPKISINLSGVTLLKNDLRGSLVGTLERYRVLPKDIDLEITESAFTQYPKESATKVKMLRDEGFTISMDDFGTGASSLNRLADMAITTIKLDKAFLDYNLAELKGSVIIGNMINMARRLGLEVVAEGVETKQQLTALKMLHCDLVQGYYFSKPVNEDDFLAMLAEPTCLPDTERIRLRAEENARLANEPEEGEVLIP